MSKYDEMLEKKDFTDAAHSNYFKFLLGVL